MKKVLILLVTGTWSLLLSGFAGSQLPPASKIVIASEAKQSRLLWILSRTPSVHEIASSASPPRNDEAKGCSWLEDSWRSNRLVSTSA